MRPYPSLLDYLLMTESKRGPCPESIHTSDVMQTQWVIFRNTYVRSKNAYMYAITITMKL